MDEAMRHDWLRDSRTAALISIPFWLFALVGFYPAYTANPHSGILFALFYAVVLLPGALLAYALSPASGPSPWVLMLGAILLGQFLGIYLVVRLRSWLRSVRSRRAQQ